MPRPTLAFVAVAWVAVVAACGSDTTTPASKIVNFKATMNAAAEVQATAVTSSGTGTFTATLDTSTNVFIYDVTYAGLTSNVTAGHIHGPATTAASSGTTINFGTLPGATFVTGASSGTAHGQATLNAANQITATINGDSLRKVLFAGLTYANIHTTTYGAGEIRGQILQQ
ncbi:MAG: CHRD domain-containing protein [bacterium]